MAVFFVLLILVVFDSLTEAAHNTTAGCAIIRPPRDGGIRYRGLTQEQIRSVQVLPVDYEIEYICRGNRVIVGPKVRKCLPNGTWTDLSHRSKCLLPCAKVQTSLENGRVVVSPPGPAVEGTVLHYSCLTGFILEGRNSTQCTKLGKWDSPKPTCRYDRHHTEPRLPPVSPEPLQQLRLSQIALCLLTRLTVSMMSRLCLFIHHQLMNT
ncbi:hypothetical protein AOLI_G00302030 [Acnodon oligacanthus]